MAKVYLICCQDVGVDCDFTTRAGSVDEVIERCAEHGRAQHGRLSFAPAFYLKMRRSIHVINEQPPAYPDAGR